MLDKLKTVADRYEAVVSQLEDPAVYADSAAWPSSPGSRRS